MFRLPLLLSSAPSRRFTSAAAAGSTSCSAAAAAAPSSSTSFRHQSSSSSAGNDSNNNHLSIESVWALWNEGNLFSLSAADLSQFLSKQNVTVDTNWKKAALVRQVEDVLRAREAKRKQQRSGAGAAAGGGDVSSQQQQQSGGGAPGVSSDVYGKWEGQQGGASTRSEMLLDLNASGFYSQNVADASAAAVPKAFQLFSGTSTPDLVLSRVNTTSFPGFAANAECFTFTGADATQSTKSRYSKTTQWSILNARHLNLAAEITADLGKLILRSDIVKKNRYVVSSFALQQRVQHTPSMWVSATSSKILDGGDSSPVEQILKNNGFSIPTNKTLSFEAQIRRKNDVIVAELDEKGATTGVFTSRTNIQTAYWIAPTVGQDVRFLVRSRRALEGEAAADYLKGPVLDVASDEAKSLLKPNLGEIVYASENMTRVFTKKFDSYSINVKEVSRQPLIISREEEDGVRTELTIHVDVPMQAGADKFDLSSVTSTVYDLATEIAKTVDEDFKNEFGLVSDPVVTSIASA